MVNYYDAVVVGCGLSGSVTARQLADKGCKVLVLEKRDHIAGNMYDYYDKYGILVHKYGPHTFHTNEKYLFDFICKYAEWDNYILKCGAEINGVCTPTPFNYKTIDMFYTKQEAELLKKHIQSVYGDRKTATVVEILNCKDEVVRNYAQFLFDNDYSLYTAKQWGISANKIDPSVLKRVPLRFSYDEGYFDDIYQVMPHKTYTEFIENILSHPNISIELKTNSKERINIPQNKILFDKKNYEGIVVYTGAVDELFNYKYGKLPYRSLRFEWKHENIASKQDLPVVAYPQAEGFTRIVEYSKLPVQLGKGTTYEVEYPLQYDSNTEQEPYYPVLTNESQQKYAEYKKLAQTVNNLFLCGRLADFKYYNMDQALKKALELSEDILKSRFFA